MGAILDLAERSWNAELVGSTGLMRPTFETEEVADGLFFMQGFANVSALRTDAGLVLVDTGAYLTARKSFEAIRAVESGPLVAAVYTHGHVDHAFGLPPFIEEAEQRGWPRPSIVGHRNLAGRFDRYRLTRGYNACINQRQFSIPREFEWPERYEYPDTFYDDEYVLDAGSTALKLRHARGETDDHTWIWWPDRKAVFTGDQFVWVSPNAGNPQKAQRYPDEWAVSLRRMAELNPEVLVPGHGPPILGAARVQQALGDTAEWLEHLVRETLDRMNAGADLDSIVHEVRPPAHLAERPYLQPVYDDPEYVVRNVWRLFGGWYDGVPSHLRPAREDALAREVATLSGGAQVLAKRARELAEAGDGRLAGHLADWAARAEPENDEVHAARADVYELRSRRATALMSKGVFNAVVRESRSKTGDDVS